MLKTHSRKATMINEKQRQANIDKIETQVERWDWFARIVPIVFVGISLVLICLGVIDYKQAFWTALAVFAVTAVTWWFWTISTIGHISERVHKAENGVQEVLTELKIIRQIFQDIKKDNK